MILLPIEAIGNRAGAVEHGTRETERFDNFVLIGRKQLDRWVPNPLRLDGQLFERPVANLGPDARIRDAILHTFPPHSAPCGMLFYNEGGLPERYKGHFFVTLFGNYLGKEPVGFTLVTMKIVEQDGRLASETHNFLTGLRRPIDVCQLGGKLYLLEHVKYDDQRPPRVLEIDGAK